jgi:Raf kinase inhibitor-like YbhB/YbcL family protein
MKRLFFLLPVIFIVSCSQSQTNVTQAESHPYPKEFKITSPNFKQGENIPSLYTCDSSNISPELHWSKISGKVASYALIMDDPDAPMGTWVHWVLYNIPATDTMLVPHIASDSNLINGIKQGTTSFRATGYGGPCPPNGSHRYFFRLFALDTIFNLPCKTTGKIALTNAIKGHILAEAELIGRYERKKTVESGK